LQRALGVAERSAAMNGWVFYPANRGEMVMTDCCKREGRTKFRIALYSPL
jgi:hypothetical protein